MILNQANITFSFASPFFLQSQLLSFGFVLLAQVDSGHQRRVNRVERKVREERLIAMSFNEASGLGREAIRQVLSFRTVLESRISVGRKILVATIGASAINASHVDVKTLIFGPPAFGSQMPFAGKERGVACRLRDLCQSRGFER